MLSITINGKAHALDMSSPAALFDVFSALGMKPDRIAVERNGEIVTRTEWDITQIASGDRLEVVHFVGGGAANSHPTCDKAR